MAASGSRADYTERLRYQIGFVDEAGTKFSRKGTATFDHTETLSRLTVEPDGADSYTLYVQDSTPLWCEDSQCFDLRQVKPQGDLSPGSEFHQAAFLLQNLNPTLLRAALSTRPREAIPLTRRGDWVLGHEVLCTWFEPQGLAEELTHLQRCWDDEGRVVLLTTPTQHIEATAIEPLTELDLPGPVRDSR